MVEFALVATFIFLIFVSVLQMILLMFSYNTLTDAAKEGLRYAIVHGTGNINCSSPNTSTTCTSPSGAPYNDVKDVVVNFGAASLQGITRSDVTVTYFAKSPSGTACGDPGCMVSVVVQHNYAPLFGLGWPRVTLYGKAQGRILN